MRISLVIPNCCYHKNHLSHGLAIPDALIAATSLETGLRLFTYNVRDFKFIKGLNLYNSK